MVQPERGGDGEGLLTESVGREKRIERWSEKETGGRILQEGVSMLDRRKIRSIVELWKVYQCERNEWEH